MEKSHFRWTTFRGAGHNFESLRDLFPIRDGDILSREKIAEGLENLKNAYGAMGYVNFTSVPEPRVDDANRVISLDVDVDEGRQFFVREINVLGLDESSRREVLKNIPLKRCQVQQQLVQIVVVAAEFQVPRL